MALVSINPATGGKEAEYPEMAVAEVAGALEEAHRAFLEWREAPVAERARRMQRVAALLRENREEYARLMTREMGKLLQESRAEVEKCAWAARYFAENAADFLAPEEVRTEAARSYVAFEPLGVVLSLMPWNFPFWQVIRCAVPALLAGNAVALKHASNVPGCALALEELFRRAGFPEGLFRALLVGHEAVAQAIRHPRVRMVTLTGSTEAGRVVAGLAGQALRKTLLELGGSDAYVVLEDADLDEAVEACARARLINAGQSCIAAKRFVVVRSRLPEFESKLIARLETVRPGDPLREDTGLGPLARVDLRDELHRQVTESIARGAVLRLGGRIPEGPGAYYPPTVLTGVAPGQPACDEELFGPVAAVIAAEDETEALEAANASAFGLGAAVFTADRARGEEIARRRLEAGSCFVNTYVRSDPRLPFGGIKDSGYGRELSRFGIREFVNIKTVYVR